MDHLKVRAFARERVDKAQYPARRLALLFTAGSVGLGFAITLVNFLLGRQMESAVGLGGLDTRVTLTLIQTFLMIAGTVAVPYWQLGYTKAAMETARGQRAEPKSLLAGFQLFFPGLRLFLAKAAVIFAVTFLAAQAATILYVLSPASDSAMILAEQLLKDVTVIDEAMAAQLMKLMWPMYVIIGVAIIALGIPVFYRMRLADFQLLDGQASALRNLAESNRRMRGNCVSFFRLDLSFWWYYLLQGLALAVSYGDMLISGDLAFWVFYVISAGMQLLIGWAFLPRVMTGYAVAYDEIIKEKEQV